MCNSLIFRLTIEEENYKLRSYCRFQVVPGPEGDRLMKSWVAEREEERSAISFVVLIHSFVLISERNLVITLIHTLVLSFVHILFQHTFIVVLLVSLMFIRRTCAILSIIQ